MFAPLLHMEVLSRKDAWYTSLIFADMCEIYFS